MGGSKRPCDLLSDTHITCLEHVLNVWKKDGIYTCKSGLAASCHAIENGDHRTGNQATANICSAFQPSGLSCHIRLQCLLNYTGPAAFHLVFLKSDTWRRHTGAKLAIAARSYSCLAALAMVWPW